MPGRPLPSSELAKKSYVRNLLQTIVHPGVCSGCAACVLACPVDALGYEGDKPVLLDNCIDCVLCSQACPRLELQAGAIGDLAFGPAGPPGEIGSFRQIVAARATTAGISAVAQDGGMVTAVLTWALQRGLIEGATVSRRSERQPWLPAPALATTAEELLACAGSAYTYSPNTLALEDAAARGLAKVAFVGTGCQINGLRQLQVAKSKKLRAIAAPVVLAIGLLCSETFDHQPFMHEQIAHGLGIDLADVVKINIKGRVLVSLRSGEVRSIPLKAVRPYARQGCHYCQDFGAEYADISAGGLGLDGWTIATLRTAAGEEYFAGAARDGFLETQPAAEFPAALDLYARLALKQRERPQRPQPAGIAE